MKKFITMFGALFAFSLSVFAGNPGVTFLLRGGQKVSFSFAEKPVVTFSEADFSVSVHGVKRVSCAYAEVVRVTVEDDVVSAINETTTNGNNQHVVFNLSANSLEVSGLAANEKLSLYTTDGKLMLSDKANTEGKSSISLSFLHQGIYVVRTQSGISYKLFKK